jgi:hypothetical protein
MILTEEFLRKNSTMRGGWTKKQLAALGVSWPPKSGWMAEMIGKEITQKQVDSFLRGRKCLTP